MKLLFYCLYTKIQAR